MMTGVAKCTFVTSEFPRSYLKRLELSTSRRLRTSSLPLCTALRLNCGNPVSDEISAQVSRKCLTRVYRGLRFGRNEWNALEEVVDSVRS